MLLLMLLLLLLVWMWDGVWFEQPLLDVNMYMPTVTLSPFERPIGFVPKSV